MKTIIRCRSTSTKSNRKPHFGAGLMALLSCWMLSSHSVNANVYATNIRLNGRATETPLYIPCGTVQISYLLNEPANAGVTIDILDGTTVVHSIALSGGSPGTEQGYNAVVWDAFDNQGHLVPYKTYTVRITAASNGYGLWTQISDDFNPGNYVWDPVSIAVNRNTNSPFYGRVFVANGTQGPNPVDRVGILKLNADGSSAADGLLSTGGWPWTGDGFSPWKIEVSADDYVYINDWTSNTVLRFDQTVSYESRRVALGGSSQPGSGTASFGGFCLTGSGADAFLWMADVTEGTNGFGVRRWPLGLGGDVAASDLGSTVVQAGEGSDLNAAPYDVAVDVSNRIYAVQYRTASQDAAPRLLCFPPYTNGTPALTNAEWIVGEYNNGMRGAAGVAVNSAGTWVAAAFRGVPLDVFSWTGGHVTVFDTATGNVVTNFVNDLGGGANGDHTDVAWDNVENLYFLDRAILLWRAYSPPGSNAASTVATAKLRVAEPEEAPILQAISKTGGTFQLLLTGRTNLNYVIEASPELIGATWIPIATNKPPHACATRAMEVSAPWGQAYYRARSAL